MLTLIACISASSMAAFPMLLAYATSLLVTQDDLDSYVASLEDVDPVIRNFVHQRLNEKIPLKAYDGFFAMEASLDIYIGFSKEYEQKIKEILLKEESCLTDADKMILGNFTISLEHELFHIQDQHAQKLRCIKTIIPICAEVLTFPLLYKLTHTHGAIFTLGLLGTVGLKLLMNKSLENAYRRYQEKAADEWSIQKSSDTNGLNALILFRKHVVLSACTTLFLEYQEHGSSRSSVFNMLIKLFGDTKSDADAFYEKLNTQPAQWPLRLLSYVFDPEHPFVLDAVPVAQKRLAEIQ